MISLVPPSPLGPPAAGIGLRTPHADEIIATRPPVGWLEVHPENYLCGGPMAATLERVRGHWPLSLHGVGLSLGSAGGIDGRHLARIAALVDRLEPALISEHLAWSGIAGVYLNDLLPLPYTEEALAVVADNIARIQERLSRQILIENPSQYLRLTHAEMTEPEFLRELVVRTGCGLLLDVNNIFVTCANVGGDVVEWLDGLPAAAVREMHLAGHARNAADGTVILIDDHGSRVAPAVWELYDRAVQRFPHAATLIEWDSNLPALAELVSEAATADRRRSWALAGGHHGLAA
jgi:hypothetical protein